MDKMLKKKFALTEQGAKDSRRSGIIEFVFNMLNMVPLILLMTYMDRILMGNDWSEKTILLVSIITIMVMLFIYVMDYNALYTSVYRESENTRVQLAERLKELPLSYFSRHDLSDISQTLMADVEAVEHAMGHAISKTIGLFLFLPVISVMLIIGNVKLGLAVVIPMAVALSLVFLSKKIQVKGNTKYYHVLRENSEAFQENIELNQEIRSYGLKEKEQMKIFKMLEEGERIHLKIEVPPVVTLLMAGFVLYLSLAIVIIIASKMYMDGEIGLLYAVGYIIAAAKIKDALDAAGAFLSEIFYLDARVERIRDIKEAPVQQGSDTDFNYGHIVFDDVFFSYDRDTPVLTGTDFTAEQGRVTALVGRSGCGKTSILRLISRLYDYDSGTITIGGRSIKDMSPETLFSNMSIVFQDVSLFGVDFMENIRLGRGDATDEEVIEAAKLANCHEFIMETENGYHTEIGENGSLLSGGERQRISIARAFLKDAPIIILDEIMAALDVENEMEIQDSLNRLIEGKTVIIISHRMRSIENVDRIVVIDDGVTEAQGSHIELMENSPIYANLVEKANFAEEFVYQ